MNALQTALGRPVSKVLRDLALLETAIRKVRQEIVGVRPLQKDVRLAKRVSQIVADKFSVPVESIWSRNRVPAVATARMVSMTLTRELGHLSSIQVGRIFNRHHGDVLHAKRAVRNYVETCPKTRAAVEESRRMVLLEQAKEQTTEGN